MTDKIVILCTCSGADEAERLGRSLVEARLAACVNVIPQVRSYYRWQGALESAEEWLLVIKSSRALFEAVRGHLAKLHSYEVPEILALPVVAGSDAYLNWLDANLASPEETA
ncbi:MAG TPA: divalent-cation tolerance protein CutA [Bryobacteraceae bacterium]|nr:divalent-cation tolerance protein CutA [Bryobacteraceae bacterium]